MKFEAVIEPRGLAVKIEKRRTVARLRDAMKMIVDVGT
jgi:hypothetical protein